MKLRGCLLVLVVLVEVQAIPRYCTHIIKSYHSARSEYEETKITHIRPRCPQNGLTWQKAEFNHIVVFSKGYSPFRLCVTLLSPAHVTVHRLRGTSRQLIASAGFSGDLGCFESECKHLTFLLEPDNQLMVHKVKLAYSYQQIEKNSKCTAVCQQSCLFNSEFVFIGSLEHIVQDAGLYRNYFRIGEFIKYNGTYVGRFRTFYQHVCGGGSSHDTSVPERLVAEPHPLSTPTLLVPTEGLVKVHSKRPVLGSDKLLLAASPATLGHQRTLTLCCVEEDESYAVNVLRDLTLRQQQACPVPDT